MAADMTAYSSNLGLIAVPEGSAPRLADDARNSYDVRLEDLLQGQQEVMNLVLGGAHLEDVLHRLVLISEQVFAPARCGISLVERESGQVKHQAAAGGVARLAAPVGALVADDLSHPAAAASLSGERIIILDFGSEEIPSEHARKALESGLRCCWVEPFADCGEGLSGSASFYYPEPREPDAGDEHILWTLTSFMAFVINAAQREVAFRAANERFAALVSAIPGVVYQRVVKMDGDIRYTYISEGARDLFGVSPQEILSDPEALFKTHSPDYKAKFRERLLAASKALTMWDVEASLVTPDGRKKYTHALARPDRQPDGSVLWTGVILDETRTREAIIDSLSQGFLLYDANDRLIMRNSHYLKLFPALHDVAVPGATYEEIVKGELAIHGKKSANVDLKADLHERVGQHQNAQYMFERQLDGDRWLLVNEQRTADGGTVVLYTDISELKQREKQIRHLAYHDILTGLPNRALFSQRLDRALADARQRGTSVAVVCIDVDYFKNVNDTLGHSAGDAVLKFLADRLQQALGEDDFVARLGGDEFGIVLVDLDRPEQATQLAWRLLSAVSQPIDLQGQQVVSGISMGISSSATDGDQADQLLKNADLALYRAKSDGRGTFRFFAPEMDARAQARRALEMDLRQALIREQFELHYQPQLDVNSCEIIAFEALVRWRHPERGLVAPCEFIPTAEETGVIVGLGEWVLRRACEDAIAWPDNIKVAVNVSAAQFRNHDLADFVARTLKETGLKPERLELEITESLLLRDVEANLATLTELKTVGVRVSMDDFGTGYSSLGNLRSFPFDKIKIDRSFVNDLEQNAESAAIVRAVLGLGRSLGMVTCAEGVETEEQLARLRGEGCAEVQGFYFSKPQPVQEIPRLLGTRFAPVSAQSAEPDSL
jgi:diguanylate cyclase (GGDEF)-like protein